MTVGLCGPVTATNSQAQQSPRAVLYEPPFLLYNLTMNNEVADIIEKIKAKYSHIDTILIFGSAITPEWTKNSDIDIFPIDDILNDSRSETVVDNVNIEFQEDNFTAIKNNMEQERGNLLHRNLSTMVATSIVVSTKSPEKIAELIKYAKSILASPTKYDNENIKMWRYSIADYLGKAKKDIARNDTIAFYFDAHYVLQNALELSLATHNTYMPQPKHLTKLLAEKDPELFQIWQNFMKATTLEDKLQTLLRLNTR